MPTIYISDIFEYVRIYLLLLLGTGHARFSIFIANSRKFEFAVCSLLPRCVSVVRSLQPASISIRPASGFLLASRVFRFVSSPAPKRERGTLNDSSIYYHDMQ